MGLGLLVEEHRGEVVAGWRRAVQQELGTAEPALAFAAAPLLRELALATGGDAGRSREAWARCAVLVRSTASPAQLAREFKVLHRTLWEALRARGAPVGQGERRAADEWLDEALAEALDRLERVRVRAASLDRGAVVIPARAGPRPAPANAPSGWRPTPPPLPARSLPPPLPGRAAPAKPEEEILELEPVEAGAPG